MTADSSTTILSRMPADNKLYRSFVLLITCDIWLLSVGARDRLIASVSEQKQSKSKRFFVEESAKTLLP